MGWWILLLCAATLCMAPVQLTMQLDANKKPTLHAILRSGPLVLQYDAVIEREQGTLVLSLHRQGAKDKAGESVKDWPERIRKLRAGLIQRPTMWRWLKRTLHPRQFLLHARFGAGDAAHTAAGYGALAAAAQMVYVWAANVFPETPIVRVHADFSQAVFLGSLRCIFRSRIGHIIAVALLALTEPALRAGRAKIASLRKQGRAWKSTQSRA